MSVRHDPYRHAEPTRPEVPPLKLGWEDVKSTLGLFAIVFFFWISSLCIVPLSVALIIALCAWGIAAWRASPRRNEAKRAVFALVLPCLLGAALFADDRRADRVEAQLVHEARAFRRERGRYPTSRELSERVPERGGVFRNRIEYWNGGDAKDDPIVIRGLFATWKRVTRVASGRVSVLD